MMFECLLQRPSALICEYVTRY